MKKITMFLAVALTCTAFAFAAEDSAPQNELHMQAPQITEAAEESAPVEENVPVVLPEAAAPSEEIATPSEEPVDEEMLVTPEAPAENEAPATESEAPVDEDMLVTPEVPAEPEATEPEEQLPAEDEATESEAPATPSEEPVDEDMLVTPEVPAEPEVTEPEEQLPTEEEVIAPEEELPAEEEEILVEIPENEIPVAAAPVAITVCGIVYDGEATVYMEEQTIEATVGDELDLGAFVWTETPGITLTCDAAVVTVSADTTAYVLTYELQEGWVIL
ncbi:hypothetical protein RWV98_18115 [Agathobaculum sp. NTUH-O15-33]|uniref:hypothetical protein n=1 Tax=Agathobaculum sp. NTUH-O15-33 TaxID=3079302 RepID=UPI0029589B33|nr:hypothetical protein [Agathobaculum sp. NTUH-O15-33]WNX84464.1 hypothetical protein RWV98_18115 [Agathobaculum sp. NTUH-O15-33]